MMRLMKVTRSKPFPPGELGDAAKAFLLDAELEGSLMPKSLPDYSGTVRLLSEMYPNTPLAAFDGPEGSKLLKQFLGTVPLASKKKRRAHLKSFFEFVLYYYESEIQRDPTARLKVAKTHTVKRTPQPVRHIELLIALQPTARDRLAIMLGYPLGLRRAAVRGIRMRDFNAEGDFVRIVLKGGKTTTQTLRFGIVRSALAEVMSESEPDEYLLFGTRRMPHPRPHGTTMELRHKPMEDTSFHRWWTKRFEIAQDVPYFDFHTLRTTSGHEMYRMTGQDTKAAQLWLKHASARTTLDHYIGEDAQATEAGLAKWDASLSRLESVLSSKPLITSGVEATSGFEPLFSPVQLDGWSI